METLPSCQAEPLQIINKTITDTKHDAPTETKGYPVQIPSHVEILENGIGQSSGLDFVTVANASDRLEAKSILMTKVFNRWNSRKNYNYQSKTQQNQEYLYRLYAHL